MTRIVQRLRMRCIGRKGCYCRKEISAFPASIRWTPPEVLEHPQADEESGVLTHACDVYAFSMVMWEVATVGDPFEEVSDEGDVSLILKIIIMNTCISKRPQSSTKYFGGEF